MEYAKDGWREGRMKEGGKEGILQVLAHSTLLPLHTEGGSREVNAAAAGAKGKGY